MRKIKLLLVALLLALPVQALALPVMCEFDCYHPDSCEWSCLAYDPPYSRKCWQMGYVSCPGHTSLASEEAAVVEPVWGQEACSASTAPALPQE